MNGQNCGTCRFWQERWTSRADAIEEGVSGGCRRHPPTVLRVREIDDFHDQNADYPATPPTWWCGEYAPANPETVADGAATLARFVLLGDMTAARALADKLRE